MRHICSFLLFFAALIIYAPQRPVQAQQKQQILTFSVGPDITLTYPSGPADPPYLVDLPDEHTTFLPPSTSGGPYLVFAASKISGGTGGTVALQSTDLVNFTYATPLGYSRQVMASPIAIDVCDARYTTEFDGNYAAAGSVLQDPTLPPGNFIMLYEAENHCPAGVSNPSFYATVGFARSSDSGKTWPAPVNGVSGGAARHPVLQSSIPQPTSAHGPLGNAIPSAFIDRASGGDYVYVTYADHTGVATNDPIRIARAKLGTDPLTFLKWNNGSFGEPGIGGADSAVLPFVACGNRRMPEITRNDDVGVYVMLFTCVGPPTDPGTAAWYYSTATDLDRQDWGVPQMVANSRFPVTSGCGDGRGDQFDGWYPSSMSPSTPTGHTKLTGFIFYQNGCDTGKRTFAARAFTITAGPAVPVLTSGSLANGATYLPGGLVPGSWAQVKGSNLSNTSRIWQTKDFEGVGNNLPTTLDGVQVKVNNLPAALYFIDPSQVNFQVPAGVTGMASVQVINNGTASNTVTAQTAPVSPGLFTVIIGGVNYPAAVLPDGKYAGDPANGAGFRRAKPGDAIQLYATGLAVTPAGVLPTAQGVNGVSIKIGDVTIPADFAGLVAVGEFQINFRVPQQFASAAEENYPISISVNGVTSPAMINSNPPGQLVIPIQH